MPVTEAGQSTIGTQRGELCLHPGEVREAFAQETMLKLGLEGWVVKYCWEMSIIVIFMVQDIKVRGMAKAAWGLYGSSGIHCPEVPASRPQFYLTSQPLYLVVKPSCLGMPEWVMSGRGSWDSYWPSCSFVVGVALPSAASASLSDWEQG